MNVLLCNSPCSVVQETDLHDGSVLCKAVPWGAGPNTSGNIGITLPVTQELWGTVSSAFHVISVTVEQVCHVLDLFPPPP